MSQVFSQKLLLERRSSVSLTTLAYLVSGFFMFALHAATLDAPTLVFKEYNDNFVTATGHTKTGYNESVRSYIAEHMKDASPSKVTRLSRHILKLAHRHHFAPGLILSVIRVESNFQPWAVSQRGALGMMQIMPDTGEWLARLCGMRWLGPTMLLDEETNITMGVRYLAFLRDRYDGDLKKMLSAYNRGPAKVDEEVATGRSGTLAYYHKIRQYLPHM